MKVHRFITAALLMVATNGMLPAQEVFRYTNNGQWIYTGSAMEDKLVSKDSPSVTKEKIIPRSKPTVTKQKPKVKLKTFDNLSQNDLMFKVHTNMVYDAALAPNGGIELSFNKNWTVGTDGWIAWLRCSKHNAWYEHYGFDVYGRYWFGKKHTKPFVGYHVGPYAGTLTYDLYPEGKGYQCNKMFKTFRIGAEFGYAVPVKNFTFDFYAGIGFLHTRQDVYYPNHFSNGYYKAYRRYRNLPDFTRLGITIGYVFGK